MESIRSPQKKYGSRALAIAVIIGFGTIEMAAESLAALEGSKNVVQLYLLDYLKKDEEKHDAMLEDLSRIKKAMYP